MRLNRNYYEILGVARTASPQEIRDRYRELARKFHPDRAQDKELAQRIFSQVNRSYTTLSNPEKRAVYDVRLIGDTVASRTGSFSYSAGAAPSPAPPSAPAPAQSPAPPQPRPSSPAPSPREAQASRPPAPDQIRQWLSEAGTALHRNDCETAMRLCRDVLAADPRNVPGLTLLGDLLVRQGRHGDALVQYQCAAAIQPANREVLERIARIQAVLDRKAQAKATVSASRETIAAEIPPAPGKPEPKKSLMDRFIPRKK